MNNFTPKYRDRMFVVGETNEASEATTTLIEMIVRNAIIDIIITASDLAARRGSPKFAITDLLFQIRHDPPRLERLRDYLRLRKIRSTAAKSEKEASGDADITFEDDSSDALAPSSDSDSDSSDKPNKTTTKPRKTKPTTTTTTTTISDIPPLSLPWSTPLSFFPIPLHPHETHPLAPLDLDTDPATPSAIKLSRLRKNDALTRRMTHEDYIEWHDKRKSSFTSRKKTLFREWCLLGEVGDHKVTEDEVPGLLNLLAVEIVERLTEEAMRVKREEDGKGGRGDDKREGEQHRKRRRLF
ncbi:transcription initiation factor IID, 18kD subunit-domain-containing protein [Cercophora newfieldiana]|uniref:Transcription initiation factor IID, 18kD subunit-domain-containing protein n=1 Tax=Cercophora newfieldiana TaxID=92897 RepID=A0AA39YI56_9PEZI|nr:transcription initiation factor IID, 18kD subunit-domain-containing protein [Cercophora newfieldiana]